ncbi:MAG TPA: hypothetical protein VFV99_00405 [Kofleriaceae bacterium]|nr:hypothetical protein [Kofleriaceae bacterium]
MRRVVAMLTWLAFAACDRSAPAPAQPPSSQPATGSAAAVVPADAALAQMPVDAEVLAQPNRPLTAGEIAMLEPIFKDSLDYKAVRVINNSFPFQPENVYMTPRGHVYAPGGLWQDDFSIGVLHRAVFVHEMTHVWQYANGMDLIAQSLVEFSKNRGDYEKAYAYDLDAARDLTDYGLEQQASIVEDYFMITSELTEPLRIKNRGLTHQQRDTLYAAVLKQLITNPRYARNLDAKQIAAQHAATSEKTKPGPAACKESEAEHGTAHMCSWRFEPTAKH